MTCTWYQRCESSPHRQAEAVPSAAADAQPSVHSTTMQLKPRRTSPNSMQVHSACVQCMQTSNSCEVPNDACIPSRPTYPGQQSTRHATHGVRCLLLWVLHHQLATRRPYDASFVGLGGVRMAPSVRHALHHGYTLVHVTGVMEIVQLGNCVLCRVLCRRRLHSQHPHNLVGTSRGMR